MFWATITNANASIDNEIATFRNDVNDDDRRAIFVSTNRTIIEFVVRANYEFYRDDSSSLIVEIFDDSIYEIVEIARNESIDFVAFATIDDDRAIRVYVDIDDYDAFYEFDFRDFDRDFIDEIRASIDVNESRNVFANRDAIERVFAYRNAFAIDDASIVRRRIDAIRDA